MIELLNITKTFNAGKSNAFTALKGIDLRIDSNRVTVFRGPSGSGKTTLLSIIGCMLRPTSGRIILDGRETTSLPERFSAEIRRKTFGFVSQNFNLIKGLTTLENTMIPAYPTGKRHKVIKGKAMKLLERFGLGSKASQRIENLSGGEQQRTVIARALMNDPLYIVADEPTAHLDTELAGAFIAIVSELIGEGKTVFLASHDPLIYNSSVVHRVISIRDGAVVPGPD